MAEKNVLTLDGAKKVAAAAAADARAHGEGSAIVGSLRQGFILLMTAFDAALFDLVRTKLQKDFFRLIPSLGKNEKVSVTYGPKYTVAVVYAPPGRNFICFEPMSGITNAFNLAHAGVYKELQSIPPGGRWRDSFWVSTSGF